jgi:hypothetical protein
VSEDDFTETATVTDVTVSENGLTITVTTEALTDGDTLIWARAASPMWPAPEPDGGGDGNSRGRHAGDGDGGRCADRCEPRWCSPRTRRCWPARCRRTTSPERPRSRRHRVRERPDDHGTTEALTDGDTLILGAGRVTDVAGNLSPTAAVTATAVVGTPATVTAALR